MIFAGATWVFGYGSSTIDRCIDGFVDVKNS